MQEESNAINVVLRALTAVVVRTVGEEAVAVGLTGQVVVEVEDGIIVVAEIMVLVAVMIIIVAAAVILGPVVDLAAMMEAAVAVTVGMAEEGVMVIPRVEKRVVIPTQAEKKLAMPRFLLLRMGVLLGTIHLLRILMVGITHMVLTLFRHLTQVSVVRVPIHLVMVLHHQTPMAVMLL